MHALFLDLASNTPYPQGGACIACVSDDTMSSIVPVDNRIGDAGLMPLCDEALSCAGWSMNDLTHIACVIGPGGFTSLRVAVSLANVLADQLKIPATGVHLSDVFLSRSTVGAWHATPLQWIHATKKQELFMHTLAGEPLWPVPMLISLADLVEQIPKGSHVCGELLAEQRDLLASKSIIDAELQSLYDVLPSFLLRQAYDSKILQPWYGRGW